MIPRLGRWAPKVTRDATIFVGGLVGLLHETLISKGERPTLIAAFVAMIGLPAFIRSDESKDKKP